MKKLFFFKATLIVLMLLNSSIHAEPMCKTESFPQLPDVTITSATQESAPAPHCKVSGVVSATALSKKLGVSQPSVSTSAKRGERFAKAEQLELFKVSKL